MDAFWNYSIAWVVILTFRELTLQSHLEIDHPLFQPYFNHSSQLTNGYKTFDHVPYRRIFGLMFKSG